MPAPVTDPGEPGHNFEWSETLHAFLFRARIYLKRYWWIFFLTLSGGVGLQAYRQYTSEPVYLSDAELFVRGRIMTPNQGNASYTEDFVGFYQTQIVMLMGPQLQKDAHKVALAYQPEYATKEGAPRPWVHVEVTQRNNTSFLHLVATGNNPGYTQLYLKSLLEAFLNYKKQLRDQAINEANNSMMTQVNKYEEKVKALQVAIRDFLKENNSFAIASEVQTAGAQLAALNNQLSTLRAQQRLVEGVNFDDYVEGRNVEQVDRGLVDNHLVDPGREYFVTKQELLRVGAELDEFSLYLRPAHPKRLHLVEEIGRLENILKVLRRQTANASQGVLGDVAEKIKYTEESLKDANARATKFSELQSKYDYLDQQLKMYIVSYQSMLSGVNSLDSQKDASQEVLSVYQTASDPLKLAPNPVQQIGQGAFVGLIAGSILIFLLGALDGRVMSVEDITQRFDEPMLGVIPMQKRIGGQVELLKNNDQRQMFAESCRNIRSSLLYMDRQGQRPRLIVLTSSIPAEGKSTLSANLSITLGFAASRTLLVDADLRRGQLHKLFGLPNDMGLAEHIQDGVPIEKVIQPTGFENLDFIASGHYPNQPGELLMSERFKETLEVLKQRYDFVIFDSPPVMATDDAGSFATRVDAVLFVIRAGYTRLRQVRTSLESLHRRGVNVYGMVVNFIDHREPGYYSYKYYDYYSYRPGRRE